MSAPRFWKQATRELPQPIRCCQAITARGATLRSRGDAFNTLARSIVGQQISVKAAQSVWNNSWPGPGDASGSGARHDADALRSCGLSRSKVVYLHDSPPFRGRQLRVARWKEMSNEELIIGAYAGARHRPLDGRDVPDFLYVRPDVLPLDDIGLQDAMSRLYYKGEAAVKAQDKRVREKLEALAFGRNLVHVA